MTTTKTGAAICVKHDAEKGMSYTALVFINNIPEKITDAELESKMLSYILPAVEGCEKIIYRADIQATSNEVQEQFEQLHDHERVVPHINYPQ